MQRLRLPPDVDATAVIAAVGDGRSAVFGAPEPLTVAYLDTFDWRLHGVGLVLAEELGRDRRLTLLEPGRPPLVVPVSSRPHTAAELPPGHLGEVVGRTIGIRALLEVGATRVERRDGRVEDPDGNLLARLRLERVAPVDGAGAAAAPAMTTLGIDPPGALSPTGAVPLPGSDLEAATAARDRQPGDYSSKLAIALDPEQSADGALRVILRPPSRPTSRAPPPISTASSSTTCGSPAGAPARRSASSGASCPRIRPRPSPPASSGSARSPARSATSTSSSSSCRAIARCCRPSTRPTSTPSRR